MISGFHITSMVVNPSQAASVQRNSQEGDGGGGGVNHELSPELLKFIQDVPLQVSPNLCCSTVACRFFLKLP